MCLILKSEGVLSPSYQFKLGQATVQNNLPDLNRCIRARQEENLSFMQLVKVQSKDMTRHYFPMRQIASGVVFLQLNSFFSMFYLYVRHLRAVFLGNVLLFRA